MNKDTLVVSTIIVAKLLTRLPMKRGERPTVSTYIGVIILFFINGIITPFHFSSLTRERVCQDDFCKFSKFKYLSAEKSPNISCLHIS